MPSHQQPTALDAGRENPLHQELFARFHAVLVRFFARRIRVEANAEDLAQETLLRVIRAQTSTDVQDAEKYVFRIAINLLRNYRSRVERVDHPHARLAIEDLADEPRGEPLVEDFSPERVLIGRESLAEVLHALGELEERTRNIFVLFKLERMRQKEIAALYGIGQSTVEKHIMKATAHLLARRGSKDIP